MLLTAYNNQQVIDVFEDHLPHSGQLDMATVRHEAGRDLRNLERGDNAGYNRNARGAGYIQVSIGTPLAFLRHIQRKETDHARSAFP